MARPRNYIANSVALAAFMSAAPLAAQATNNAVTTQTATPAPAPAPATSGTAVGPPQLRDFNLNGTVTQPAQPPLPAATMAPRASPRASPPPVAATAAPAASRDRAAASRPTSRAPVRDRPAPEPLPGNNPLTGATTDNLPPATMAPVVPAPSFAPSTVADVATAPTVVDRPATSWWPWLAAGLAIVLGGAFLWWRRREPATGRYAADHADIGALVSARDSAPTPLPRTTSPPRQPAAATTPARPQPAPPAEPVRSIPAAPSAAAAPVAGGIVASGLKPRIEYELVPIRAEIDDAQGAALTVDILVINRGGAPARDVMIESRLINAGPQVDAEVGRFFMQPPHGGERIALIGPMARTTVRVRLAAPAAAIAPLLVGGRKLLVPLVAINARYRWNGGDLTDSASFIVGRGDDETEKLAPFRLDIGARGWSGLSARLHSNGLQP